MYEAGDEAFKKTDAEYLAKEYPLLNDFSEYGAALVACALAVLVSLELDQNAKAEVKLQRYNKVRDIIGTTASTTPKLRIFYNKEWNSAYGKYTYVPDTGRFPAAILIVVKQINEAIGKTPLKDILASLEKEAEKEREADRLRAEEEKRARIKAYWEAHAEEKAALEAEKAQLTKKKDELDKEIGKLTDEIDYLNAEEKAKVPSEREADDLKEQIRTLEKRRANLGIFSGKEKKQITEEISTLQGRIDSLKEKIQEEKKVRDDEIRRKREPLRNKMSELVSQRDAVSKRISAINDELTKDPTQ